MGTQYRIGGLLLALCLALASPARAEFAVAQSTAPTSNGGTQDFAAGSGFGTPSCALFWGGFGTANGTAVADAGFWIGAYDGVRQTAIGQTAGDNLPDSDTGAATDADSALITLSNAHVKDGDGTASWITDGARLTWADAPPAAYRINAWLVGGSSVSSCYTGTATGNASIGGTTAVVAPGFTPDVLVVWSSYATANWRPSVGFATNEAGPTIVQRSMGSNDTDASANMQVTGRLCTNRIVCSSATLASLDLTSFDANGFTVTTRDSTSGVPSFGYLALKLNGLTPKLMTSAAPTATGSQAVTGVGFQPQTLLMLQGEYAAVDTDYTADDNEIFAVSAATSSASASSAAYNEDSDGTSNTESITDNKVCRTRKDGADYATCTLTSLDADGATFNYTLTNGTARQRAILFLGAPATATGSMFWKRRAWP